MAWCHHLVHSSALCHSSRPLGTLVISLQQLQSAGHLVLREALVDEKLRVSPVSTSSPPSASLGLLQTKGENLSQIAGATSTPA